MDNTKDFFDEYTEQRLRADRNDKEYQSLHVVQEVEEDRQYIRFTLMESRWRSIDEAVDYLEWATEELKTLQISNEVNNETI